MMRVTILLLILSIVVAYPKYKEAREYYHDAGFESVECGTMSGQMLSSAHEGYGLLGTAITYTLKPVSFYLNNKTRHWKVMGHDAFTGYTCTILEGNTWLYGLEMEMRE